MAKGRRLTQKEFESRAKIIGGSIIAVGGILLGRSIYLNWKAKQETVQHDKYITDSGINLTQVAIEIYDAFYNYGWGMVEDETQAINSLLKVPKKDINRLALIYNKKYNKNLYEDFRNYLSTNEYNKVEYLLN